MRGSPDVQTGGSCVGGRSEWTLPHLLSRNTGSAMSSTSSQFRSSARRLVLMPSPERPALFGHSPQLEGPWEDRRWYPDPAKLTDPSRALRGYGLLSLPDGRTIACEADVIPDQYCAWLDLSIPMAMVEAVLGSDGEASNSWTTTVNNVLLQIADAIFREVPFNLALIGESVSGFTDDLRFKREHLERGGYLLSPSFCKQAGLADSGVVLASGLRWLPPRGPRM